MIAFVCAMPMELTPLKKKLGLRRTDLGWEGELDGRPVVAAVTGMGTELATRGAERLLDAVTPERVVVFGITGAVDDETPLGTLIVPDLVIDAASGREHRNKVDGAAGVMWTTNLITTADELPALRARGVVSLDMETAAIAHVCEQRSVPWSVFRVISDRATDGSVTDDVFRLSNQDGTPNATAIVRYFLRHPGQIPQLMRMGKSASAATKRAADAAIAAVR
jgi:adenosylhomocysteine nucleosidase